MAEKSKYLLIHMLPMIRALYQIYQHMHWKSAGSSFYGDHLLYERLYGNTQSELDKVAEKVMGILGNDAIGVGEELDIAASIVGELMSDDDPVEEYPMIAIKAEKFFLKLMKELMSQKTDILTDGVQNMVQEIADKHEEHLYLLQQRNKKAAEIQHYMKWADYLDGKGLYVEADLMDAILKKAVEEIRVFQNPPVLLKQNQEILKKVEENIFNLMRDPNLKNQRPQLMWLLQKQKALQDEIKGLQGKGPTYEWHDYEKEYQDAKAKLPALREKYKNKEWNNMEEWEQLQNELGDCEQTVAEYERPKEDVEAEEKHWEENREQWDKEYYESAARPPRFHPEQGVITEWGEEKHYE